MSGFCACGYDDEYPDLARTTQPRARQAYRCDECRGPIAAGERHQYSTWLFEGDWSCSRVCIPCLEGPVAFTERNCGCTPWGYLREHLEDVIRDYPFKDPAAKARVEQLVNDMRRRAAAPGEEEA